LRRPAAGERTLKSGIAASARDEPWPLQETGLCTMYRRGHKNRMKRNGRDVDTARRWERQAGRSATINTPASFQAILRRERSRSDRDGSEFALAVFDVSGMNSHGRSVRRLADLIKAEMRSIDEVGWIDTRSIGVMLPVTSVEGARIFTGRIGESVPCRVFAYPKHWLPAAEQEGHSDAVDGVFCRRIPLWKSIMDVTGALILILLGSPLFLLMAVYIRAVSPGKVIFRQKRVGYQGKIFSFLKFRTMHVNSDTGMHRDYLKTLIKTGLPMEKLDGGRDPRIIPRGKVIRKLCLDELPQLFNVLRRDMSLVGPRPCIPYEAEEYLRWHSHRFDVLPGMTGLWQVSGKNKLTFEQMIRLDIAYTERLSPLSDIRILLMTLPAIIKMAYEAGMKRINTRLVETGAVGIVHGTGEGQSRDA
jgi:lipopolysaccharide/colanic/teichoic acid biosynthesis glycosyltransferase